ncbi:nucleotide-diphospho-sugar transferase [Cladochytrium replicatum]|nr:nucleotide-diphospho-sugar transferase [Cladochytrium replicatum]
MSRARRFLVFAVVCGALVYGLREFAPDPGSVKWESEPRWYPQKQSMADKVSPIKDAASPSMVNQVRNVEGPSVTETTDIRWIIPYTQNKPDPKSSFPYSFDPKNPKSTLEAALVASYLTTSDFIPRTSIPRIIHYTWKNADAFTRIANEPVGARSVDEGLLYAEAEDKKDPPHVEESLRSWRNKNPTAVHLMWTDDDADEFVKKMHPGIYHLFRMLPRKVLKADMFRYLVLHTFGGVYTDVDTVCLKPIDEWILQKDIKSWLYEGSRAIPGYNPPETNPISTIVGVETDVPISYGDKWKSYYRKPLQLCQWTFAAAPGSRIMADVLHNVLVNLRTTPVDAWPTSDPTYLTGPAPWTDAIYGFALEHGVDLERLRGYGDEGRMFGDVLILPITAFSPGLGQVLSTDFGSMGAKRLDSPEARVRHLWKSVWRGSKD